MDWHSIIEVGAILIAGIAMMGKFFDKSLSRSEHEEFRRATDRQIDQLREDCKRETDGLDERVRYLERNQ